MRRLGALLGLLLFVGCTNSGPDDEDDMARRLSPWHMWGNSPILNVMGGPPGSIPSLSVQGVQITYKRPESWHFLFRPKIINVVGSPAAANFTLQYNLTIGLGRDTIVLDNFVSWIIPPASFTTGTRLDLVTQIQVATPGFLQGRTAPNLIDTLVASNIQVQAVGQFDAANTIAQGTQIECSAFFSPYAHVRPDWFVRDAGEKFLGDEIGGN